MLLSKYKKKILLAAAASAAAFMLCACKPTVGFSAAKVEQETAELKIVIESGETALLNQLPNLKKLDLSGSGCYEEIMDWAGAHPNVELSYTVAMPDGCLVPNSAESADLTAMDGEQAEQAAALFKYLPCLKELVLPEGLSVEQVNALCGESGLRTEYSFSIAGQELDYYAKEADLSALTYGELPEAVKLLSHLPELKTVELGSEGESALSTAQVCELMDQCPELEYKYNFYIYGVPTSLSARELDLSYLPISDGGAQIMGMAPYMKKLTYLDMDSCGLSNQQMEVIRAAMPDVTVVWRIWFASNYSVRTDTEKILASKPSMGGLVTDADGAVLKYCTKVKYLDLGHNEWITDISFMACMPELEVAVLAMNCITDISPLGYCTKLEYLEIQTNDDIGDISALANCPELAHLNVARCRQISDISPLFGLKKLERVWLGSINRVPAEQIEQLQALLPDCRINTTVFSDPTAEGWRYTGTDPYSWNNEPIRHERYALLCEQFGYDLGLDAYSFPRNDPKYRG